MIFDTVFRLPQYVFSNVWKELDPFITRLSSDVPEGKHLIRESDVFAQVSSYKTCAPHEGRYESHKRYIDIQILLSGSEIINVTHLDGLVPKTDYDIQNDIRFYQAVDVPAVRLHMLPGSFALFFPHDSHCPQLSPPSGIQEVKKVVIKIDSRFMTMSCGVLHDLQNSPN